MSASIVETFLEEIVEVEIAKTLEENGLDQDCKWISVNALILIGCMNCDGTNQEKAEVLFRMIQPSTLPRVTISNQNIRMCIFYMTNLATVLSYMKTKVTREGKNPKEFDFDFFKSKMISYEVVFESVL